MSQKSAEISERMGNELTGEPTKSSLLRPPKSSIDLTDEVVARGERIATTGARMPTGKRLGGLAGCGAEPPHHVADRWIPAARRPGAAASARSSLRH